MGAENRGYPDADELQAELRRQEEAVARLQKSIDALSVPGYSRGNEVSATVRGNGRLTEIRIDPDTVRRYDTHELGEIVLEAVNDALGRLSAATKERFDAVLERPGGSRRA